MTLVCDGCTLRMEMDLTDCEHTLGNYLFCSDECKQAFHEKYPGIPVLNVDPSEKQTGDSEPEADESEVVTREVPRDERQFGEGTEDTL